VAFTDQTLAALSVQFHQAAVGMVTWEAALEALAKATGSQNAELIGFGSRQFHLYSGLYDGALQEFASAGGQEPAINSRIRVGLAAAEMMVLDEAAFTTESDCRRHREYGKILEKLDIPFVCLTPLQKKPDSQIGLSVMRSGRVGNIERDQKRVFAAAAPHILNAITTALALEGRAIGLVQQAFESLDEAAFVIDGTGRAHAWTSAADALLGAGVFRMPEGRLALAAGDDAGFQRAVAAAVSVKGVDDQAPAPVLTYDQSGLAFLVHVTPLPRAHGFNFDAAALVVAKRPRALEVHSANIARQIFGLTPSEAAVAGLLASGLSAQAVADRQGVALGTVRTHIRRLLEKSGTMSQLEFLSALAQRF
jgi:DNA-binding CsgD family transcriptional regulator/PAS domain-containing protein